jgi:hypothetical protein
MNGMPINDGKWEEQQEILSNAYWDSVFQILEFMINDIFPSDFEEISPNRDIKLYFKKKYQILYKQNKNQHGYL